VKKVKRLQKLRRKIERQTGEGAGSIELPLSSVLSDVCSVLGMSRSKQRKVLGRKGTHHLTTDRPWQARLK
jgi:hypothetical protein